MMGDRFGAITGIGQSEIGRPSKRSAMQLTVDAALEAMRDAGLKAADIDGIACWPGDNDNGNPFSGLSRRRARGSPTGTPPRLRTRRPGGTEAISGNGTRRSMCAPRST